MLPVGFEKLDGLLDSHFQNVVDILALIFHLQHITLETLAMAGIAHQFKVGHKLHLDRDHA